MTTSCDQLLSGPGEDDAALMDWACLNSIGWYLGGSLERIDYANEATEMYIYAEQKPSEEEWDNTLEVSQDLVGWYDSGNDFAVDAFIEVNDCFDRAGEFIEENPADG